jgi:DNA (cytosine-5)-methyltransferase 1
MCSDQRMDPAEWKFAEFFAGIGLMRMGLEAAGWSIAFANDIDKDKLAMYTTQYPDAKEHFILGDIHTLPASSIPSVTLATASFPCTDLSLAGMRRGLDGAHSSAYWGFARILEELKSRRPPIVLLENVVGFLSSHKGKDFHDALLALNRLGYAVDAVILDAARFVPQSRVRLFVIGSLTLKAKVKQRSSLSRETPCFYESTLRPRALADFILRHPDIAWNLRELPEPPQRTTQLRDILEKLPESSSFWWNTSRVEYLVKQMSPKHHAELEALKRRSSWAYGTVFRRVRNGRSMAELRTDGVAGCLRTPRGGSGRQILVQAGHGLVKARLLTPKECARLMGADGFRIDTSLNKALFGFGDAVCVSVISWLARNYLNPLTEELLGSKRCVESSGTV